MSIPCSVIQDLLPLYHDDVCSIESKIMIEEHLKHCSACQNYLMKIDRQIFQNNSNTSIEEEKVKSLQVLRRRFLKKNVVVSVVSIFCAVAMLWGVFIVTFYHQIPIFYKHDLFHVIQCEDSVVNIEFNDGKEFYKSHAMYKVIKKGDIEEKAVYVYCTDTIWIKHLSKPEHDGYGFSIGTDMMDDFGNRLELENVDTVYYLVGNYNQMITMPDAEFFEASKDAVLVWKK